MTLAAREVGIWLGTPNGGAIVEAIAQSFPRNAGKPPRFWRSTLLFSFMRAATTRFSALELSGHARDIGNSLLAAETIRWAFG